jgi:putative hydrolase of the HAD superfamily
VNSSSRRKTNPGSSKPQDLGGNKPDAGDNQLHVVARFLRRVLAMRIPVLMFDFGNVVAFFDYSAMFDRLGQKLGLSAGQFEAMMHDRGAPRLALEFERGRMTVAEFAGQVTKLAELNMSIPEFVDHWSDIFTLNEPVARLAAALKERGHTLLLGSNTNELHALFYRRKFEAALSPFDHFVLSYQIGELKPDRAFFDACLELVEVNADRCVFIDDTLANVEGARATGLHAVHYRDTPNLVEDLRRLGIEVPDIES